jgi:hypothetical protein
MDEQPTYFLRYVSGTPIKDAVHQHTLGKHETYLGAIEALDATPEPWRSRLEVVSR